MVALGPHTAGVMSNDDALANELLGAAQRAGEEMWRLPLPPRLGEQLKSDDRRLQEYGRALGRRADGRPLSEGFVGPRPVGPCRHRRPVERDQGARPCLPRAGPASPRRRSWSFSDAPQPEPRQFRGATNATGRNTQSRRTRPDALITASDVIEFACFENRRQQGVILVMEPTFRVGDLAVYPAHGVAQIVGIETREISGNNRPSTFSRSSRTG